MMFRLMGFGQKAHTLYMHRLLKHRFSISLRISKDLVSLVKSGFFKKFRIRNLFRSLRILWGGGNMVALPPLNP